MNERKILILSESGLASELSRSFAKVEAEVYRAKDSVTAMRLIRDHDFLCAVSDLSLPAIDHRVYEKMMEKIPTIVISDGNEQKKSSIAKKCGAVDFLTAPFSEEDLLFIVEDFLADNMDEYDDVA